MNTDPKILIYDLECTPQLGYFWGHKWQTDIVEMTEPTKILSYSAKWLDGNHITKGWPDYKGYKKGSLDDKKIVEDIWNLFNEADIIVTQNGKAFDTKLMNSRFVAHKLTPPTPYKVVDTKTEAKKYLNLPSYALDFMCDYFGIGRKKEHEGFPLWIKCMAGDSKAWDKMLEYNKHDVVITEQLYLKLRPWMSSHPNVGMYTDKIVCSRCGSGKIQSRGMAINKTTSYKRYQCLACGGWGKIGLNMRENKPIVSI